TAAPVARCPSNSPNWSSSRETAWPSVIAWCVRSTSHQRSRSGARTIAIEPTGTWQTWTTLTVPGVFLEQGVHQLRLEIDDGDFNLNHIDVE
ncbi:MAG: carbohydrate-binding domain-containing protein, partial [Planctomycetota bacterium]|nr:carbohydrate-binding domain-containing protein [Planctomycetota bacterium]